MIEIITTINTKTITSDLIQAMLEAGSTIFRINMSHTEISSAIKVVKLIRKLAESSKLETRIMIDIPGPEVRIANLRTNHNLSASSSTNIYFEPKKVDYYFSSTIKKDIIQTGDRFYLQDGDFSGSITDINQDYLTLTIDNNNILRPNCHFSIPGKSLHQEFLSSQDKEIIRETAQLKPDFFALSFVNSQQDIQEFQDYYTSLEINHKALILSKFETAKSLANIESIIKKSDYLYIARGDLGIEVSIPLIPTLQKQISRKCQELRKPFFVATQMMESMVAKTSPTRAEISDVANAIFDGASGVTLSDETAIGKHPIEAIRWMKMIIEANEGEATSSLKQYSH